MSRLVSILLCTLVANAFLWLFALCIERRFFAHAVRKLGRGGKVIFALMVVWFCAMAGGKHAPPTLSRPLFIRPSNAIANDFWRRRGAADDAFRITNWWMRLPVGFAEGITVLSRGEIRAELATPYFPRLIEGVVSLAPNSASEVWHALTPSNSLLITWQSALYNRDANAPTNFQAELFHDGHFVYRYGAGHEITHECELSFECPSAWEVSTDNPSAYYFVDVVASRGPVQIRFDGDRTSGVSDPVIATFADVTNHVPLLIGVRYAVTSEVPFSVSVPSDGFATYTTNDVAFNEIYWPLNFEISHAGNEHTVRVTPFDPGGTITWARPSLLGSGGANTCNYSVSGNSIWFTCEPSNCGCNGCSLAGSYMLEGTRFPIGVVHCGCVPTPPPPPDDPPPTESETGPSVSVAFSKSAVIFEDAYQNSATDFVPKRSTQTTLDISAYGGTNGATIAFSTANLSKLSPAPSIPPSITLEPYATYTNSFLCEAASPSSTINDISVTATLTERNSSFTANTTANCTAIKFQLTVENEAPLDSDCIHRHVVGACEKMWFEIQPSCINSITTHNHGTLAREGITYSHVVALDNIQYEVTITYDTVSFSCPLNVLLPQTFEIVTNEQHNLNFICYDLDSNQAGCLRMEIPLKCVPSNLSFSGLEIKEEPTPASLCNGYFVQPMWDNLRNHQGDAISADWFHVNESNYIATDIVEILFCPQPWINGLLIWNIPTVCRSYYSTNSLQRVIQTITQQFSITSEGCVSLSKFGCSMTRMTNEVATAQRLNL